MISCVGDAADSGDGKAALMMLLILVEVLEVCGENGVGEGGAC